MGRSFAGNDIVYVTNGKALNLYVPSPRVFKPLDAIRGEHQVQVKWSVLQLHKILAALNFGGLVLRQRKTEFAYCRHQPLTIFRQARNEQISILRRVWETEQNRAGLANE